MSDNTLQPWQVACGYLGDFFRLTALALAVLAIFVWGPAKVVGFLIVFGILLVPRFTKMPRPFDAAFAGTLVLAALVGSLGWYETIPWSDIVVHTVTTGACAAMLYLVLSRFEVVHSLNDRGPDHYRARIVVLTGVFGLAVGVIWEFLEWAGNAVAPEAVHVGYTDTIGDLAADLAGSIIAGIFLLGWADAGGDTRSDGVGTDRLATKQ